MFLNKTINTLSLWNLENAFDGIFVIIWIYIRIWFFIKQFSLLGKTGEVL